MKKDNSGIDLHAFTPFIETMFPIGKVQSIRFMPKGEEGYGYLAQTESGNDYFVKVQAPNVLYRLSLALDSVSYLYSCEKLAYVVPPIQTFANEHIVEFEDKWVSLFPYIKGASLYELGEFTRYIERIAEMMANLHHVDGHRFAQLPKEQFQHPFEGTIVKLLHLSEHQDQLKLYQQKAAALFFNQRKDIEATLVRMRDLQKTLSEMEMEYVVTHGDANFANILRDEKDHLSLIDWGQIGLAPVERDLMFFIEVDGRPLDFERFLTSYFVHRPTTRIHYEVFEYYFYYWCLQEIVDYGSRLLLQTNGIEEDEHSWNELQPYLPIPHRSIQDRLSEIRRLIHSF